jgi:hypothetical protein
VWSLPYILRTIRTGFPEARRLRVAVCIVPEDGEGREEKAEGEEGLMPINSWDELYKRQLVPLPNGHARWFGWRELRDEATPKFRRIHDHTMRRIAREIDVAWHAETRRAWQVSTRKYRSRKRK